VRTPNIRRRRLSTPTISGGQRRYTPVQRKARLSIHLGLAPSLSVSRQTQVAVGTGGGEEGTCLGIDWGRTNMFGTVASTEARLSSPTTTLRLRCDAVLHNRGSCHVLSMHTNPKVDVHLRHCHRMDVNPNLMFRVVWFRPSPPTTYVCYIQ
jgi:hypothetical protein